jgi:hypothetical protein
MPFEACVLIDDTQNGIVDSSPDEPLELRA